jgi:hypothetical protein
MVVKFYKININKDIAIFRDRLKKTFLCLSYKLLK